MRKRMRFFDLFRMDRSSSKPASSGKANERDFCNQLRRLRYRGEAIRVADPAGTKKDAPDTVLTLSDGHVLVIELKENKASEGGGSNLVYRDGHYARPKNPVVDRYYPAGYEPWEGRAPSCIAGDDKSPETWAREKDSFPGLYLDVADTAVSEYYRSKKVDYIHVKGKGIYHTGTDPMGWGVPAFTPPCRLRIRAKQHHGTSVPNDVQVCFNFRSEKLPASPYDFMDPARLPPGFAAE